jgi:hypothetical protein
LVTKRPNYLRIYLYILRVQFLGADKNSGHIFSSGRLSIMINNRRGGTCIFLGFRKYTHEQ